MAQVPARLYIVRHGQSAGNVAREKARAARETRIDVALRDMDVPLSPAGQAQSRALAAWFKTLPEDQRPDVVLTSPYARAIETARIVCEAHALSPRTLPWRIDERLREREFGVLDRLTTRGIAAEFPAEAEARRRVGKFYHRAPGGESWCDVILRLRSAMHTLSLAHAGQRVLIVCHQVVVLCFRYLLENLDEAAILTIDREADVANCGVTEYVADETAEPTGMRLVRYNVTAPITEAAAPVTAAPDANVAPR